MKKTILLVLATFQGLLSLNAEAIGFTGAPTDLSELTYLRARYYDPETGSFLSKDPIGIADHLNQYAYVGSDRQIVDTKATILERFDYDLFGMVRE